MKKKVCMFDHVCEQGTDAVQKADVVVRTQMDNQFRVGLKPAKDKWPGFNAVDRSTVKPKDTENNNPILMAVMGAASIMSKAKHE